ALTCVGYLPSMPPADRILGVRHTDFSNMHFYGSVNRFPQEFKSIDRRVLDKGFSLGECGAQEAHDLRVQGSYGDVTAASIHRFQTYVHYGAATGAAFMANWSWKDFDEMVFPWGLMRHGSYIAKPWLHTLTQESLLLSLVEPKYESPQVFVLAPDRHRIGPRFNELHDAVVRSVELMLDQRVNFGIVNEEDLDRLPESAKALLWPIPYCPDDATFERVLGWVKAGGRLYLSGDVSFDVTRKPTRTQRRQLLNLPEATPALPFATLEEAWRQLPLETSVGKGKVFYVPYPLELRPRGSDKEVYARFLATESRVRIEPQDAPVRALSIPTRDGGRLTMLARTSDGEDRIAITLPEAGVTVELAGGGFSFVLTDAKGSVLAAESQGAVTLGGKRLAQAKGHFAICSLDHQDLRQSLQILLLPHEMEQVDVSGLPRLKSGRCGVGEPGTGRRVTSPATQSVIFPPGFTGQVAVIAPAPQMEAAWAKLKKMLEVR
ncbi:MAG: hypothetical protein HY318_02280, partial [Armatimonadetes bacterium]|nr:hypothetical protein [Armatimonadota bacterium]